jgi:hypothetical protein
VQLPADHPLVKAFNAQKAELADFRKAKIDAEDAAKTDLQKSADKITALESENAALKGEKLRAEVARSKSDPAKGIVIDPDLLVGSTKEELEASADKLVAFKGGSSTQLPGNQRPTGPVSQVQGEEESREDRKKRLAEAYQQR